MTGNEKGELKNGECKRKKGAQLKLSTLISKLAYLCKEDAHCPHERFANIV